MEKETFVEEIVQLALAQATEPPYTTQKPLTPTAIETLFEQAETASEVLDVIYYHLRELLSTAKAPLIHLLEETFTGEQLQRVGIFINPAEPPRFTGLDHAPYLLIDDPELRLSLSYTPVDLHIYAHPMATLALSGSGAMIYGQSRCQLTEGNKYTVNDFVHVEAGEKAQCVCDDYSVCHALDGSVVKGMGFSTLVKCGEADIHTFVNSRLIVNVPDAQFTMHRKFRPVVQTQPETSIQYAYTHPLRLEGTEPLTLSTQHERQAFEEAFSRQPGNNPFIVLKNTQPYSVWRLADLLDKRFQRIDMGLCDLLEDITTKEELTDLLAKHFELLRPFLGITFIREQFDAQQLAKAQIFIDDTVRINTLNLQGEFHVFGNHIVDQPAGTIGHYYDQTIAHVRNGIAHLRDNSVAVGNQSLLYGYDHSLIYGHNVTAQLRRAAIGSFHGESIVQAADQSIAYLYDQTEAECYDLSQLVLMDDAKVLMANGGTIYGNPEAILKHNQETTLYTDKQTVDRIRQTGLLPNPSERKNTHQIHH